MPGNISERSSEKESSHCEKLVLGVWESGGGGEGGGEGGGWLAKGRDRLVPATRVRTPNRGLLSHRLAFYILSAWKITVKGMVDCTMLFDLEETVK